MFEVKVPQLIWREDCCAKIQVSIHLFKGPSPIRFDGKPFGSEKNKGVNFLKLLKKQIKFVNKV